eukprot:Nk52_evm9s1763 gene=Nk52_evmTU9s1763
MVSYRNYARPEPGVENNDAVGGGAFVPAWVKELMYNSFFLKGLWGKSRSVGLIVLAIWVGVVFLYTSVSFTQYGTTFLSLSMSPTSPTAKESGGIFPSEEYIKQAMKTAPGVWAGIDAEAHGSGKRIPKLLWQTWRDVPFPLPAHIQNFVQKNPSWAFHAMDDEACQQFMDHFFKGTPILGAYNNINPRLGAMKADIWRYAVLYIYGGLYVDSDSSFDCDLDAFVQPSDGFIFAKEGNPFKQRYAEDFYLGPKAQFNSEEFLKEEGMGDFIVVQWMFFSEPRHVFLKEILANVVRVLEKIYLRKENEVFETPEKMVQELVWFTTGPSLVTVSVRKALWEMKDPQGRLSAAPGTHMWGSSSEPGFGMYRYVGVDFGVINGVFKNQFSAEFQKGKKSKGELSYWMEEIERDKSVLKKYVDS